jgi:hypothetical protein
VYVSITMPDNIIIIDPKPVFTIGLDTSSGDGFEYNCNVMLIRKISHKSLQGPSCLLPPPHQLL